MLYLKTALATILFFSIQITSYAQREWTLEECIQYALSNNIQIKQQQLLVEQDKNNLAQSKYDLLPSLNAGVDYSMSWGRTYDQTVNDYITGKRSEGSTVSASTSVTVFAGLQKRNTIELNNINLMATIQDVERLKNDVALNVAAAYLQVLLVKENVAIAEQQLVSTKEQIDKTQKMVAAGKLTKSNLLEIQAQQANEESILVKAQNDLAIAYLTLQQLLELSNESNFSIATPKLLNMPSDYTGGNIQHVYDDALRRLPEIKSSELRLKSALKSLDISKGRYYPTLTLSVSIMGRYSNASSSYIQRDENGDYVVDENGNYVIVSVSPRPLFEQYKENRSYGPSIRLSIPIFNGFQTRTQVKNAKINIRNSELELQKTKNNLYKTIQQAHTDATGQLKSYQASLKNLNAIEESFRYTEQKYSVGALTSTDYQVAKSNLFKAKADCIQAKYQYVFKMKILDFYKGIPLTL